MKGKEALWSAKLALVGNLVHDSVPFSNNEVRKLKYFAGVRNIIRRTQQSDGSAAASLGGFFVATRTLSDSHLTHFYRITTLSREPTSITTRLLSTTPSCTPTTRSSTVSVLTIPSVATRSLLTADTS